MNKKKSTTRPAEITVRITLIRGWGESGNITNILNRIRTFYEVNNLELTKWITEEEPQ